MVVALSGYPILGFVVYTVYQEVFSPAVVVKSVPAEKPTVVKPVDTSKPYCADLSLWIQKMHPEHGFFERVEIVKNAEDMGECRPYRGE